LELCIRDDLDPVKIMESGQCFRVQPFPDGAFRFITGDSILYLRPLGEDRFEASCTDEEWQRVWVPYFDLGRDYRALRGRAAGKDERMDRAMAEGTGLRILRQDPWETLLSFIISQRKSIPAISGAVETLAVRWGRPYKTERETVYTFPEVRELAGVTEEAFRQCGLGYRAPYVLDAVEKAQNGELDLQAMALLEDADLLQRLQSVRGVGKKVAECVCLFGFGRMGRVPVDVWIARAVEEDWHGGEPFSQYGCDAGIMQQYVFYSFRKQGKRQRQIPVQPDGSENGTASGTVER